MNRVQFSLLCEPAREPRVAGQRQDQRQRGERRRRERAARPRRCSTRAATGRARSRRGTSSGSARKPVSRSSTTDGERGLGRADVLRERLTRTTSPPIVDGSTLPDELPGEVVRGERPERHVRVERVRAPAASARPRARCRRAPISDRAGRARRGWSGGRSGIAAVEVDLRDQDARSTALTTIRSASPDARPAPGAAGSTLRRIGRSLRAPDRRSEVGARLAGGRPGRADDGWGTTCGS